MNGEFQRDYLLRLPLPLAQLYSRAHNSPAPRARHDNTFYLFEALIKLSACPLVAEYLRELEEGAERKPALDRLLAQLALPSLGQWVGILRELARHFGTRPDTAAHPLGHLWKQLGTKHRDMPGLLALYRRIKNGPDGEPGNETTCSLLQIFDALVAYRNHVFGHGAGRFESFYEQEMGPLMLPAANELLSEGMLECLGPKGSRLVYLSQLRIVEEDSVAVSLSDLVGLQAERMMPLELTSDEADHLVPNSVAVIWPGRKMPLRLDPLLVFRGREVADELLYLNRDRSGRQVEYLSYTTGSTERDKSMAPAMSRLLSRITGREVQEAELNALAERSLVETPSVEALFDPAPNSQRTIGDYEILAEIGRGGMGVVYLARQLSLGRLVALKMLPADLAGDELALARFRREMRVLGRCEHPHIVKVLSSGTFPDGQLYYAMEYIPGADLDMVFRELSGSKVAGGASTMGSRTWSHAVLSASRRHRDSFERKAAGADTTSLQSEDTDSVPDAAASSQGEAPQDSTDTIPQLPLPPLPELPHADDDPGGYSRQVARMIRDAASAVQAVHDQNIVHRDIKPANILLTADSTRIVLMDFGLAKGAGLTVTTDRSGDFLGTLRYAAPEQLATSQLEVGPTADVRALGVTLWELLTRRRLFEDADDRQLPSWVLTREVPSIRSIDPTLDRDLEAIVGRAVERESERRIQTARELSEYLQLFIDERPLPIRPPGAGEIVGQWIRRRKGLVASLAAAVVAVMMTAVIAFVLIIQAKDEAVVAKNAAVDAKDEAEQAKNEAVDEKQRAEQQTQLAVTRLKESQLATYNVQLARVRELADRDYEQAYGLLMDQERCPPSLRDFTWGYYHNSVNRLHSLLEGHTSAIHAVAFSPDETTLATGGWDGKIQLWDWTTGRLLHSLDNDNAIVSSIDFSPDGKILATTGGYGKTRLWNPESGEMIAQLADNTNYASAVRFAPRGDTVAVAFNKEIWLWDVASEREVRKLTSPNVSLRSMAFSPDGQEIASAGVGYEIVVHDVATGDTRRTLKGHNHNSMGIAYSPDGSRLAACSTDVISGTCPITIWDTRAGQVLTVLRANPGANNLAFSPDGKTLAVAGRNSSVYLWDIATRKYDKLTGHGDQVLAVAYSVDGRRLASAGMDQKTRIWTARADRAIRYVAHDSFVLVTAWSPEEQFFITGGRGEHLTLRDPVNGQVIAQLGEFTESIHALAVSADGEMVACGNATGDIQLWKLDSGTEVRHTDQGPISRASVVGGESIGQIQQHDGVVTRLLFSLDGSTLYSSSNDGTIRSWQWSTDKAELLAERSSAVTALALAPDGTTLADAGYEGTVRFVDIESGKVAGSIEAHAAGILTICYSRDGKNFSTAGIEGTIKIWNPASGALRNTLRGHTRPISEIAFSSDGKTLASAGHDGDVRLWDPTLGQERASIREHRAAVTCLAFSPLSGFLVTGSMDKSARILTARVSAEAMQERARPARVASNSKLVALQQTDRVELAKFLWGNKDTSTTIAPAGGPIQQDRAFSNSLGMQMVPIPAGTFRMGSRDSPTQVCSAFPKGERGPALFLSEHPLHTVEIANPFFCSATEVTVRQFHEFVVAASYVTEAERDRKGGQEIDPITGRPLGLGSATSWKTASMGGDYPVRLVTWNDAIAFCKWLSKNEGRRYRLPTEAEWEYVCRGGTETRYWSGNDPDSLITAGNVPDASYFASHVAAHKRDPGYATVSGDDGFSNVPAPVRSFGANPFGVFDTHGNLWEWCLDGFDAGFYRHSPRLDPLADFKHDRHVIRGGCYI